MDGFNAWWLALTLLEKILWCIAVPFSVLAVVQVVLELLGAGDHGQDGSFDSGHDADFGDIDVDSDGIDAIDAMDAMDMGHHTAHHAQLNLFSVKGIVIFFCAFGWLGIATLKAGWAAWIGLALAAVVGVVCMFFFAWLFSTLSRMGEEGNFQIKSALTRHGKVYLRVPAKRTGKGKVTIVAQGSERELIAMTDDSKDIPTGAAVQVIDLLDQETVLVAKD